MKEHLCRSCWTIHAHAVRILAAAFLTLSLLPVLHSEAAAQSTSKSHRKVLLMIQPEYPDVLKNGHFEGQVRLEATVLPNGSVSKVDIKGGNPMLSQYASQAVMKWKFVAGPTQTVEEVVFNFNANER
ncbi:MAG TPA: TonB family protein [Candidatus Solibacter sp.]|nr:TonB family protein [Candidatus Solibacter sp.]